jgi:Ca-activated chloride channel family protein
MPSLSEFQLGTPALLHTAWGVLIVAALSIIAIRISRTRLRRSIDASVWGDAFNGTGPRWWRRTLGAALVLIGMIATTVALARPQSDPRPRSVPDLGRDMVLLVDVSRSMLARDMAPSRLERAKLWAQDLVDAVPGTRIGIVAFAGDAVVLSPLTRDHAFTRAAIDQLAPEAVNRGGTLLGDAIRSTLRDVFDIDPGSEPRARSLLEQPIGTRDLIIVTDGDDQESFPVEAAASAGQSGVRIITIGVGSIGEGALVPAGTDGADFVRFEDQLVRSSLNPTSLAAIASATPGGRYLQVGIGDVDLAAVYRDLTAGVRHTESVDTEVIAVTYAEHFVWPLVLGLVCIILGGLIDE